METNTNITVSILYEDLPVKISELDFESLTGKRIYDEIGANNAQDVADFLDRAHETIYNCLIYKSGTKALKDTLITNNLTSLEKPIKAALIAQLNYMLDAGGDFGSFAGSSELAGGSLEIKSKQEIAEKIPAPKAIDILTNTTPKLLLGVNL